jgi:hypothetical protein
MEVPIHEQFTRQAKSFRSTPVKPSQGIFLGLTMNHHPDQAFRLFPASHANGGGKVVGASHFGYWPWGLPGRDWGWILSAAPVTPHPSANQDVHEYRRTD